MARFKDIEIQIERRTYIKGQFSGKFIGYLDPRNSDLKHENFYDLEVLSGHIQTVNDAECIRHWQTGEPEEFQHIDKFLTNLPEQLLLSVKYDNGTVKTYKVNLNDKKLSQYVLSNQVYEGNKVYGDISGEISGYLKHFDTEVSTIEIPESASHRIVLPEPIKTSKQTGRYETKGPYHRWEYYYSNGKTYWGNWVHKAERRELWKSGNLILEVLLLGFFFVPLLIYGWQIVLPIIIIIGLLYIFSFLGDIVINIFGWLLRVVGIAFMVFLIVGAFSFISDRSDLSIKDQDIQVQNDEEISTTRVDPESADSIISHFRVWEDYSKREYSAYIKLEGSQVRSASSMRNRLTIPLKSKEQYNTIVALIHKQNSAKLDFVYNMFDSLNEVHNFSRIEFAEVIVTMVQDIPYSLILPARCDPEYYNDRFIRDYLNDGGVCVENVKYGLYSPVEFMASLNGDCDTRSLFLYTVLSHYKYDVLLLSSDVYMHSIIGINLPYQGITKTYNGKKYIVWETTEFGIKPGLLDRGMSDMNLWNVSLTSDSK